jgi:uncharacterized protein (DUF433 family)
MRGLLFKLFFLIFAKKLTMTIREAVSIDPEVLSGTPVFAGTRVSIKTLFDYLETSSLEEFLAGYPSVSREQAEMVIEWSSSLIIKVLQQYESVA